MTSYPVATVPSHGLIGLVAAAWPAVQARHPDDDAHTWDDFDPDLVARTHEDFPELPPAAIALTLRVWGRMHGLMALEIYGHVRGLIHNPAANYRDENPRPRRSPRPRP